MIFSCSMIEPGQPWLTTSGSASSCFERTWMKWMSSPSISVMNCGRPFSFASTRRQSYSVAQWRASFCIVASGTPCESSETVSRSGHWVASMRRRKSSRASSGTATLKGRISVAVPTVLVMTAPVRVSQRPEPGPDLGREDVRLLPGGEVVAAVELVEVDEVRISPLRPCPGRLVDLVREDADGGRDGDALVVEEAELVLPVEAGRRDARVRQPVQRHVVEDLVPGEVADRVAVEGPHDVGEAPGIVVDHPGRQSDG